MLSQLGLDPGELRQNPAECFLGRDQYSPARAATRSAPLGDQGTT